MIFLILKMKKYSKKQKILILIIQIKNKKWVNKKIQEIYFPFLKIRKK
jgi:hypothetical protein